MQVKQWVVRNLPLIVLFAVIAGLSIKPMLDPDLWWHLATGRLITETGKIPQTDVFTFSAPNYPYVYHSWLSYLIVYQVFQIFGLWGVTLLYAAVIGLACTLLFKIAIKKTSYLSLILFLVFAAIVIYATNLRPQTYSLLGLSIIWGLIYPNLEVNDRPGLFIHWLIANRYHVLIPLFIIWVNLHGGFIWGILLLTIFFLTKLFKANFLEFTYGAALIFGICLATLVNPYTYRVYVMAVQMATNSWASQYNVDWAPLFSSNLNTYAPEYPILQIVSVLFLIATLLLKKNKPLKFINLIFFMLSVISHRYIIAFFVVSLPSLIDRLTQAIQTSNLQKSLVIRIYLYLIPLLVIPLIFNNLSLAKAAYLHPATYGTQIAVNGFPYKVLDYFRQNGVPSRMLNDLLFGGYLEWYFPENKFFADGRMDNFFIDGKSFLGIYKPLTSAEPGWEKYFTEYQFNAVLLSPTNKLVSILKNHPDWRLVMEDATFAFFLPNAN